MNNYQQFAERGDAWDSPNESLRRPRATGPDGNLRSSRVAHLQALRDHLVAKPTEVSASPPDNPALDRYLLAGKAVALKLRLAKERNQLSKPQAHFKAPAAPDPIALRRKLANARIKFTNSRAVIKG